VIDRTAFYAFARSTSRLTPSSTAIDAVAELSRGIRACFRARDFARPWSRATQSSKKSLQIHVGEAVGST